MKVVKGLFCFFYYGGGKMINSISIILSVVLWFLTCIVECRRHFKSLQTLNEEELKIKTRKEWCVVLGVLVMLAVTGIVLPEFPGCLIVASVGLLAYCFIYFFNTLRCSLNDTELDVAIKTKEVLIAQLASFYLLTLFNSLGIENIYKIPQMPNQCSGIIFMFIWYTASIFFILNDIHILLMRFIEFLDTDPKILKIEEWINRQIQKIFKFDICNNKYDESYEWVKKLKNDVLRKFFKIIHFIFYILVFAILSTIYIFIIYPLGKVRELFSMIDKFITSLVEKTWKIYKTKDLCRYFRFSIIISMIIIFVEININENILIEVKSIYEVAVTVILIPLIVESLLNLKKS